jgi:hypothetical protein
MDFIAAETINAATADYKHLTSPSSFFICPLHTCDSNVKCENVKIGIMPILFLMNVNLLYLCRWLVWPLTVPRNLSSACHSSLYWAYNELWLWISAEWIHSWGMQSNVGWCESSQQQCYLLNGYLNKDKQVWAWQITLCNIFSICSEWMNSQTNIMTHCWA